MVLLSNLGIPVALLGSSSEKDDVFSTIDRDSSIKIVFVTPEKISKSDRTLMFLKKLYTEDRLERLVID